MAGGVVFTGIFASFHDVNVFSSPTLIATTVVITLLPDIDHTRSAIGKTFYPVASYLQSRFGHRTITHSLFFYLFCIGLWWFVSKAFFVCGAYALLSHLLFDMCTKQGVPLLYPFSKRPFVLPANPSLRLSTQDHRSEAIVFVVFLAVGMCCQPLFAQGFWTSYNKAFATWEHVERESRRSKDLLFVTWTDHPGGPTQKNSHSGYFYKKDGATMIVLTTNGFELPRSTETSLTTFSHSGITATEYQHTLTSIQPDSLNQLLSNYCLLAQIQCPDELTYFDGPILKSGKFIDLTYRKNLIIHTAPHDDTETLARIQLLNLSRETERLAFLRAVQTAGRAVRLHQMHQMLVSKLASEYGSASDYRKAQIIAQRKAIDTTAEAPLPPIAPNLERYDIELRLLERQLLHDSRISANIITVTTSKPLQLR